MCSPWLWGHSISIGYRAFIKRSMKAQRSSDTPAPSNPVTPKQTPDPLLLLLHIPLRIMRFWGSIHAEEINDHLKKCIVAYRLSSEFHSVSARLYLDVLLASLWNISSSSVVSRAAASRRTGKLIWLPRHSSCNFNSGGTAKWSEDFSAVI